MDQFVKTKPSFLEGGPPAASLSAECQRDNNARQRPPQNRLHIWWARRPPTISRAAILAALLPHDLQFDESLLPDTVEEPTEADIANLPAKFRPHREFFRQLLELPPTQLTKEHREFIRALGILGDPDRAYRRMAAREEYLIGNTPILLPMDWTYRHPPALKQTPSEALTCALLAETRRLLGVPPEGPITVLDSMAGGGVIPLDAVRFGFNVFTNDLNPVAALVLRATLKYPAQFGTQLLSEIEQQVRLIDDRVRARLLPYFYTEPAEVWWRAEKDRVAHELKAKSIVGREPADRDSSKNCILWARLVTCPKCALRIPISTNFNLVTKKGQPDKAIAAFPEVPPIGQGNDCTFHIVRQPEWRGCRWPRPGFDHWHPRNTPTSKDGKAECPRCGTTVDGEQVKAQAQAREGGSRRRCTR